MVKIDALSVGKGKNGNEDNYGYRNHDFVIADGATDKSGRLYCGKTGGEIVSGIVVDYSLWSGKNGIPLVKGINDVVSKLYEDLRITEDVKDPKYRFTCGFVCARLVDDRLVITYLGDLGFRVNGGNVYREVKQVDILSSEKRSRYIKDTRDVEGSRNHIMPMLLRQFDYQNNPEHELGYGVIDGTETPEKFVRVFEFKSENIKTLELFTDGYFKIPEEASISGWEKAHQEVEKEDPYKFLKYRAAKVKDDRTVMIIEF